MKRLSPNQEWHLRRLVAWHSTSPTPATFRRECFPKVFLLLALGVALFLFLVLYAAKATHPFFIYAGWFTLGQACGGAHIFWVARKSDALDLSPVIEEVIDADRLASAAHQIDNES